MSLALTKLFLNKIGAGICRVHGGGFAGVIMCVLPIENADAYVDYFNGLKLQNPKDGTLVRIGREHEGSGV